ncbi:unnamed protein product [Lupinus luteus]|uniref:Uncharacterized protein n=1 Tax=Lupinus luteus TaxID=3873 RepID=A0AAV1XGT3_LUPLU
MDEEGADKRFKLVLSFMKNRKPNYTEILKVPSKKERNLEATLGERHQTIHRRN